MTALLTTSYTQSGAVFALVMLAASAAILKISPEAKDWAAEVLARIAGCLVSELHARATAQRSAQDAYDSAYRRARSTGNWTPAATAATPCEAAGYLPPDPAAFDVKRYSPGVRDAISEAFRRQGVTK